ncbi:demethoxyubiquinone hydroxylase family protein [Aquibaculum arenosum]|uniref:3-demethoxyubiquinol 3-hydroxylase n=1 Tax=Aquibaculum arenosum TaxID=3032591 RepID=A0ABT5YQ17_9PROT|nr:demethoxyubiquinone hydroxylase family protein [Fodinicurvata sp. CAU 1616]MDF2097043.1 demethoxyubiquinone hydroxylase family protein [Fodinicurvata sp. CAU 1616]
MSEPDAPDTAKSKSPRRAYRPGDLEPQERLERLLRVDHAGEYGAKRIYEGQLAVLGSGKSGSVLRHMHEQEVAHLRTFETLLPERRVRPTLLQPVWHIAGFALGAATAMMGERAAMACTVAIEEVIDEHYAEQAQELETAPEEAELRETIERFRAEELEHRDIGLEHEAERTPGYEVLSGLIKAGSRAAIWLSKRV